MTAASNLAEKISEIREKSGISQSKIASQLGFTTSKISRIESGDIKLDVETAIKIAGAIGTELANDFAKYLESSWSELEQPWFGHPSLDVLQQSELAMQRLKSLMNDPEVKNSFLKQVNSCGEALKRVAKNLYSTEHSVVYIGKPGVGKTTAICSEGQLRNTKEKTLAKQMIFQTGSGRSTVAEVHARYGSDFTINVTPCSNADLEQYIKDLADSIINSASPEDKGDKNQEPQVGNSAEIDRLLRNMTGLVKQREKQEDGTYKLNDPAIKLLEDCDHDREKLITKLWERMDLPKRRRTSIALPKDSNEPGFAWIAKTFKEINLGKHPEFSIPSRVEVTVPIQIFGCEEYNIKLIDTRGVDEPNAPRRDLQQYMDDDRALVVLCSDFVSAPDAAIQSVISRGLNTGCEELLADRASILVITKEEEDTRVFDDGTGEEVGEREIGRAIRSEQMKTTTLRDLGVHNMPVRFLDVVHEGDCENSRKFIVNQLDSLRKKWEKRAGLLIDTVDRLIANKADEKMKEAMDSAFAPILQALSNHKEISDENTDYHDKLVKDINGVRYASSLRASVNRRGDWQNFNYWHGLGNGARQAVKARTKEQVTKIMGVIETQVTSSEDQPFGNFLVHFQQQFEEKAKEFFVWVGRIGETAFYEQFHSDDEYWHQAQRRWGAGKGYKDDISGWTDEWFDKTEPRDRSEFLDAEITLKWKHLIEELQEVLDSSSASTN